MTKKKSIIIPNVKINNKCIEHEYNRHLFSVIPVIYGAVLSYAIYALAIYLTTFPDYATSAKSMIDVFEYFKIVVIFLIFFSFIIDDLGEVIKFDKAFPFKRTSRYTHEFIICFLFLCSFALLSTKNSVSIITFGLAIAWGGIWCNQLKEEYKEEYKENNTQIINFFRLLRTLQYLGGLLIAFIGAVFVAILNNISISWHLFFVFVAIYPLWKLFYYFYIIHKCGNEAAIFLVSTLFPDRWMIRGTDDEILNFENKEE